jgi:hypothetical protein
MVNYANYRPPGVTTFQSQPVSHPTMSSTSQKPAVAIRYGQNGSSISHTHHVTAVGMEAHTQIGYNTSAKGYEFYFKR